MSERPKQRNARSWWGKLGALTLKECKQVVRDPSSWVVAILLPIMFLLFFGFAISLDADNLRVAVMDESKGALSTGLKLAFVQSPHFRITPVDSRQEATRLMTDSAVQGVLVIPPFFDVRLGNMQAAPIQLMVDGKEPTTATFINGYTLGVVTHWENARMQEQGRMLDMPIGLEPVYWYNDTAKSRWALVPGSITIVMALIGILLTSLVITREWERGTMEALFASPVSRAQIFLSKLIPYYLLAMFAGSLCALAGHQLFGVPFRGSLPALLFLTSAFLMPSLGQGLLISSIFRSQLPAAMVGFLSGLLPSLILSGLLFDIHSMPWAIRGITHLVSARYFNVALQTLFLAGDVWPLFFQSAAYMLCLGAVFFTLTYLNLQKRLD